MKTIKYLTLLLFVPILFTSCDKLSERRFSTTLIKNFEVDLTDDNDHTFSEEAILTSLDNEDLALVQEAILRYEIVAVKYKIWEFAGTETATIEGELKITSPDDPTNAAILGLEETNLSELNSEENHREWDLSSADQDKIKSIFLEHNEVSVSGVGNVSEVPAHFVLQIVMDVDAIAEVEDN